MQFNPRVTSFSCCAFSFHSTDAFRFEPSWLLLWFYSFWVYGLCPTSGILKTREHNISETGFCFRSSGKVRDTYSVGSKNYHWKFVGKRSSFRNFTLHRITDDGQSRKSQSSGSSEPIIIHLFSPS
jgi:hypothetical protein